MTEDHEPVQRKRRHSSGHSKRRFQRHDEDKKTNLVDVVMAMSEKKANKSTRQRTSLRCPVCVNDFLCHSRKRRLKHKLLGLFGVKILRCEHCNRRYYRFRV